MHRLGGAWRAQRVGSGATWSCGRNFSHGDTRGAKISDAACPRRGAGAEAVTCGGAQKRRYDRWT